MDRFEDYIERIQEPLKDLDIGLLIANAGAVSGTCLFQHQSGKEISDIFKINSMHVIFTIKVLLGQLIARYESKKLRSGIMITSSGLGNQPVAGVITYSASKAFASFIGEGLNFELKDKVDVMSYQAGTMDTNLLKEGEFKDKKLPPGTIKPELAAEMSLRDLGHESMTIGAMSHELGALPLAIFPKSFLSKMMVTAALQNHQASVAQNQVANKETTTI